MKECGLKVGPVSKLAWNHPLIPVSGIGGHTIALGYVVINVQIEGIASYRVDQVALVILDLSGMGMKVPVILGTPMIHRLCCQMKDSELKTAPEEWQHALLSYEVAQQAIINAMSPMTGEAANYPTNTGKTPMDLDEIITLKDRITIPAFASQIVGAHTKETFMIAHRLNIMVQPQYLEDKARLLVGLYMQ